MNSPDTNNGVEKFPAVFAVVFFMFWFCLFALTLRGVPSNGDPVNYFVVAQGIADKGSVALEQNKYVPLVRGVGGAYYSKFGIGQSLAEVPFYGLAKMLFPIGGDRNAALIGRYFITELSQPFICALICVLFAFTALRLGFRRRTCVAGAFLLGLATLIWPYSKIGFSEPLQALTLLAAFHFAIPRRGVADAASTAMSGFFFGCLILTKAVNLALAPLFLIYIAATGTGAKGRAARVGAFLLQIAVFFSLLLLYNKLRFGSLMDFGYKSGNDASFGFSGPVTAGLYGLLFSPGKSVFIYAPVLFVSLFGAARFHRARTKESLLLWTVCGAVLVLYSCWWAWHGDWCWGPRFLVPVVPLAMLPALIVVDSFRRLRLAAKAALVLVVAVSLFVQALGVTVSFYEYIMLTRHQEPYNMFYIPSGVSVKDDQLNTHYIPEFSPVAGHAWLLKHEVFDRGLPPEKLRERMRADFPWRSLMRYAPPNNPERAVMFDVWWRYLPRFVDVLAGWVKVLVGIFCAVGMASLGMTAYYCKSFRAPE